MSTSPTSSGSSAEVGSSNSITSGRSASARAMATRCCCPPESWCGYLCRWASRPTLSRRRRALARCSAARALPVQTRRQQNVLQHGQVGEQVEALEYHADAAYAPAHACRVQRRAAPCRWPSPNNTISPLVQAFECIDGTNQRGLARARRSDDADDLTCPHPDVHALEHGVGTIGLVDVQQLQRRWCPGVRARAGVTSGAPPRPMAQAYPVPEPASASGWRRASSSRRSSAPSTRTEHGNDGHVVHGDGQQGFQDKKVLRIQALPGQQQLGQGDHRHQRRELDDGDEFVDQRGQAQCERPAAARCAVAWTSQPRPSAWAASRWPLTTDSRPPRWISAM